MLSGTQPVSSPPNGMVVVVVVLLEVVVVGPTVQPSSANAFSESPGLWFGPV